MNYIFVGVCFLVSFPVFKWLCLVQLRLHGSTLELLLVRLGQSSPVCSVIGTRAVPAGCQGLSLKSCVSTFYAIFMQRSLINHMHECIGIIHERVDKSKKNTTN